MREESGSDSRQRGRDFSASLTVQTGSASTQPPIQWVPGAVFMEVKRREREAYHSSPSSAEVKDGRAVRFQGVVLN
jgi:hypothetical protein